MLRECNPIPFGVTVIEVGSLSLARALSLSLALALDVSSKSPTEDSEETNKRQTRDKQVVRPIERQREGNNAVVDDNDHDFG